MGSFAADTLGRLQKNQELLAFRFGYRGWCISLGRKAAVIQLVSADDQAASLFLRGSLAIKIKEFIAQGTVTVPRWELRTGLRLNNGRQPSTKDLRRLQFKAGHGRAEVPSSGHGKNRRA